MVSGSKSPRSQQRARVFDAYRGRGRKNNNLWLVYSVKSKRDWIFTNDRKLVHWLCFLESDQSVLSFEVPQQTNNTAENSDCAADVLYRDGHRESHIVCAAGSAREFAGINTAGQTEPGTPLVRMFSDTELQPKVVLAMRWLKALGYAAAIRDQEHTPVLVALLARIQSGDTGKVSDLITMLAEFDHSIIFGLLVRLAIEGQVTLDFNASGYCLMTRWHRYDNGNLVS